MWNDAVWLKVPVSEIKRCNILHGDMNNRSAYFRVKVNYEGGEKVIDITANTKYRLWINGKSIISGPCKGDLYRHFHDTIDITPHLQKGKNTVAVQVLYCDSTAPENNIITSDTPMYAAVGRWSGHRLAVEGEGLTTGQSDWKVYLDGTQKLYTNEKDLQSGVFIGAISETVDFTKVPYAWKEPDFDDSGWAAAEKGVPVAASKMKVADGSCPWLSLEERPIPFLYNSFIEFSRILTHATDSDDRFFVAPFTTAEFIFDAGVHLNAYMSYAFESGRNAEVNFTYAEKFEGTEQRDDIKGNLSGMTDQIILAGKQKYEPFWYRTFRFLKIQIKAGKDAVLMKKPVVCQTGYPLSVLSYVSSSEKWVEQLWNISLRTLKNCMMDTYMDCLYYEQLQYIMDTRLQALFTYSVSADTRLAKKALQDFHASRIPCGLLQAKFPSSIPQIISTFSLHFIYMLTEYYNQTGDISEVKKYLPQVDEILNYYNERIENGLVSDPGYWPFVDWVPQWQDTGVPQSLKFGPSTIINLMYGYALKCASILADAVGRQGLASEYGKRKENLNNQIQARCWDDERGMYREGPDFKQFTQHAQAWAVLNGMNDHNGKELLTKALNDTDVIECTFSTSFELFRALEHAGMYAITKKLLDKWIRLLDLGCTTCPETPTESRSECHAWSALPMYELIRVFAGIKTTDGWETVVITPHLEYVPDLKGETATPKGNIIFDYKKESYNIVLPKTLNGQLIINDKVYVLSAGENLIRKGDI